MVVIPWRIASIQVRSLLQSYDAHSAAYILCRGAVSIVSQNATELMREVSLKNQQGKIDNK
jgi:hypothetical protein